MITHAPPVVGNLLMNTFVARHHPTSYIIICRWFYFSVHKHNNLICKTCFGVCMFLVVIITYTNYLQVYRVNNRFNVLYIHGPVPGHKNTYVRVTDAKRRPHKTPPPFPTYIPDPDKTLPEETYSDDIHLPHEGTIEFADKRKEKRKR